MKVIVMLLILMVAGNAYGSGKSFRPLECQVAPDRVIVKLGATKHPTYFAIETPDDRFVYIRYPPEQIDVLGKNYFESEMDLPIGSLSGYVMVNGEKSPARVFATSGEYRLIFQDANTAFGMDLHKLACTVHVKNLTGTLERSAPQRLSCTRRAVSLESSSIAMANVAPQNLDVGCNYVGGCGVWPCCHQNFPGQPCYCSSCCIARPLPDDTLVAQQQP